MRVVRNINIKSVTGEIWSGRILCYYKILYSILFLYCDNQIFYCSRLMQFKQQPPQHQNQQTIPLITTYVSESFIISKHLVNLCLLTYTTNTTIFINFFCRARAFSHPVDRVYFVYCHCHLQEENQRCASKR